MTIAIFGNAAKKNTIEEVIHLLEFMQSHKVNVLLSQELRQEMNLREYPQFSDDNLTLSADGQWITADGEPLDFALSVGGDGTFLTTASAIGDKNIPILGINCGHLGFLADVQTRDVDKIMRRLIQGKYTLEQRSVLALTCSEGGHISLPFALNEVAVMKQALSSMITIETLVNGQPLHTYEADGLVIATPTGSTAYNLSIGGPLMVPQTRGILLSPIATHSLNVRPLVIPDDWKIDLRVRSRNGNYLISVDGRSQIFTDDVTLHIERAPYTVKLVQIGEHSFLKSLKDKLLWGAN
ncbi:MAG: NAD kinase [Paludibacteraceae bacterium]|nr:NAD kinase [Paludibacteraceae bacterium]